MRRAPHLHYHIIVVVPHCAFVTLCAQIPVGPDDHAVCRAGGGGGGAEGDNARRAAAGADYGLRSAAEDRLHQPRHGRPPHRPPLAGSTVAALLEDIHQVLRAQRGRGHPVRHPYIYQRVLRIVYSSCLQVLAASAEEQVAACVLHRRLVRAAPPSVCFCNILRSYRDAAAAINSDRIRVLIDMDVWMKGRRPEILALRPAATQVI